MSGSIPDKEKAPVGARVQIQVSRDRKIAHITAIPPQNGGPPLQREEVEREIASAGVTYGISRQCLDSLFGFDPPYGRAEVLANALLPEKGADAIIEYHFTGTRELHPKVMPDGSVDFKDLGLVQNVRTGDILCTKTPPAAGVPGVDVSGQDIPAASGRDIALPAGNGTKISEDGMQLHAAIDGQVDVSNKRVIVMNTFSIKGDVGVGTGNIDFVGNVQIGGNVTTGFKVKAGGNVTVNGILDGGTIEAGGNVIIQNGFNGLNVGSISSGGDLKCKYLQNCRVDVGGNVQTGSIIGGTVRCSGTISVLGAKSQIYNSSLTARHTINCVNAGSPGIARPVMLEVGSDPGLTQRRMSNPKEMAELQKKLTQTDNLVQVFNARKAKGQLDEDRAKEFVTLLDIQRVMRNRLAELQLEATEIEQRMMTSGYGTIVITGTVKEGTHVIIGTEKLILTSDQTFVRFSRVADKGIVSGPAK